MKHSTLFVAILICCSSMAGAQDTDKDGTPDAQERILGMNPTVSEEFTRIIEEGLESEERRKKDSYDGSKDLVDIDFI